MTAVIVDGQRLDLGGGFVIETIAPDGRRDWFVLGGVGAVVPEFDDQRHDVTVVTSEGFQLRGWAVLETSHPRDGETSIAVNFEGEPAQGYPSRSNAGA
jgi:hypothetical protein